MENESDYQPTEPDISLQPTKPAFKSHFRKIQPSLSVISKGKKKKFLLVVLIVVFVSALIVGGILINRRAINKKGEPPVTPEEAASETMPTETPEATPTPEFERADLKIKVLNGSGVAGKAGEVKDFLEELGYKDVKTGNADSFDYQETEISIKEENENYLELLTADLSQEYTLATETSTLDEASEFGAVVIVGKE